MLKSFMVEGLDVEDRRANRWYRQNSDFHRRWVLIFRQVGSRIQRRIPPNATYRGAGVALVALGLAAALAGAGVHAQTQPVAPVAAQPPADPGVPAAEPNYTVVQIAEAFGFIDTNKDGVLSRQEFDSAITARVLPD